MTHMELRPLKGLGLSVDLRSMALPLAAKGNSLQHPIPSLDVADLSAVGWTIAAPIVTGVYHASN